MSKKDKRSAEERDNEQRQYEIDQRQQHLNDFITRRELIVAIDNTWCKFASNGNYESDLICKAFKALKDELL